MRRSSPYASRPKRERGFTLIELLVVIAIIAVLSAIVLVSLAGVRQRATNTAYKQEARQLASLLHQEFAAKGTYAAFNTGWKGGTNTCAGYAAASNHAADAQALCNSLLNRNNNAPNTFYLHANASDFSLLIRYPGTANTSFCISANDGIYEGPLNYNHPSCSNSY